MGCRFAPAFRLLLLALPLVAEAQTIRLHLKDGTHHRVREYQVVEDRVRFYSVERSEWEEMPVELVDLKRTEAEIEARREEERDARSADAAEKAAELAQRREIRNVPQEPGVYLPGPDGAMTALKQAESKVVSNKRRSVLKAITPIPIVAGKSTVEVDGEQSAFVVSDPRPEFYFRLASEERFGIFRLKPKKAARVVAVWHVVPVSKELIQEHDEVEAFRRQVGEGLYRIWPTKPLEPGEYAVVEYTEGKGNLQVWDFRVTAAHRP